MGIIDFFKKMVEPYEDEDDFFEGADERFKPQPTVQATPTVSREQALFERSFADPSAPATATAQRPAAQKAAPAKAAAKQPAKAFAKQPAQSNQVDGSLFGNLGKKQTAAPKPNRVNLSGKGSAVILFSPKNIEEARGIADYIRAGSPVVLTLDGLPDDMAIPLFHFISGIAFALDGKVQPVSTRTYFVAPANVDIRGTLDDDAISGGGRF